jgi:hypothetical protein
MKFTREQCLEMAAELASGEATLDSLAAKFHVPQRSIISKLAHEQLYVKRKYQSKTGEAPRTKEQLIEDLALAIEVDPSTLESLEKANKSVIRLLLQKFS